MARKKYGNSEAKNQRWIKEGRGRGRGIHYKPWLTVRDLPSEGRSHRVFGHKSQRTHHLFSDLELAVFLLLEWHQETTEIREQFPLQRDITTTLANEHGIRHPRHAAVDQFMSTDFLVNSRDEYRPKFALQAKYVSALEDARTIEKLELERRYWAEKDVPWMIVTDREIPRVVFDNINWLYPAQRDEIEAETLINRVEFYNHHIQEALHRSLIDIGKELDTSYDLPPGESMRELRQLLAKRCFSFDIFKPFIKLAGSDLKIGDISLIVEAHRVSSQ
ncbi:MAG: TnsA endonuclease N-terminal domain-containing protein [Candidatus Thiodiazotropha sp. (ex Lucinoma borealis)]|nr:TnsA endonuclease N-terminal domain-containing protein [Candidatus Thiodiazotropha sp. (ex Lucinoma borealis)]MCU7864158.1 TnsA endonuclease N-terminal domain-containing protein [Candidatus Thiodiazotropha sp. (ex Lucinoma borealis)]